MLAAFAKCCELVRNFKEVSEEPCWLVYCLFFFFFCFHVFSASALCLNIAHSHIWHYLLNEKAHIEPSLRYNILVPLKFAFYHARTRRRSAYFMLPSETVKNFWISQRLKWSAIFSELIFKHLRMSTVISND